MNIYGHAIKSDDQGAAEKFLAILGEKKSKNTISSPIGHQFYFRKEKRGLSNNEKPRHIYVLLCW